MNCGLFLAVEGDLAPEGTCPDVFSIGDDGVAHAIEGDVPEDAEDGAQEAADNCPVSAITVE